MALVNRNAARIIEEKNLNSEELGKLIDELLSNKTGLTEIENNAKAMAVQNSRERIAEIILSLKK